MIFRFESSSDESDECDDKTVEDASKDVIVQKQSDGNCLYFHIALTTDSGSIGTRKKDLTVILFIRLIIVLYF